MSSLVPYNLRSLVRYGRRRTYGNAFGNSVGQYLGRRVRQRLGRSRTQTMTRRKSTTSGIGVTEQHDARLIYRKRNMPRRMKRRWRKFRGKVLAVSEKDLGSQTVVFNNLLTFTNSTSGRQVVGEAGLYTLQSVDGHMNDLNNISGFLAGAATTVASGLAVSSSSKILFQSAVMDLTIRNASTFTGSSGVVAASEARMEVDVYELLVRHSAEEIGTSYANLRTLFDQNIARTDPIGGGATTEITHTLRGVTPFEMNYVLSRFGVKILSKRKYQISNGDQVTYQVRDPRRHSIVYREMVNQDGFNKPYLSRFLFVVGKLAPGLAVGSTVNTYQEVLVLGNTRKYLFKVENWTEDRSAYL